MATFTWTGAGNTVWTEPTNWQVGGAATAIAPNDPTADAVATINGPDGFEFPIISGGAAITLNSLTAAGTAHVIVGGSQLGGTGTATLNAIGSISVTSTNAGGGLVGGPGSTITTPSLTVGTGAIIGGGGTYNVLSLVNSGIIQSDGANFGLGALTVTGGTITGTGSIEVDGPSTFELGSATAETITVVSAPTETATVIFDNPGSFTGSLNLLNADTHLNLFFQGQTPTGATFDGKSLIVAGATGTIDVIPMIAVGPVVLGTSGSGEVSINSLQPPALTLERDFNGDGHSDILWQNDNGSAAIWLMNAAGNAPITGTVLDNPGPDWHVKGSGDFNGDGHADILWQNDNGAAAIWLMNAAGTTQITGTVLDNPGSDWHVKGDGDFNGDGHADILWQNDNGSAAIWLMNAAGTAQITGTVLDNPGPDWHVKGDGDFNGDGHADILWQNDNGAAAIWLMNAAGTTQITGTVLDNPGPDWHVKGDGDFNGDGHADILWQNDNGSAAIWLMNAAGTAQITGTVLDNPGPDWHVKGSEDVNGDDHADILWQNDNGAAAIWLMNAAGTTQITGTVLDNPGSDWHTIGSDDMHFINATSTTSTLAATSQADEFVLTSPVFSSETISGFDPRQDILELSKAHFTTFADVQANSAASAGGALIALDSSSSLLLSGVTLGQLHATNFVFA